MSSIVRIEHDKDRPYVVVSKNLTNDRRLSFRLRGMLVYLLGKPAGWQARMSEIEDAGTESEDAVRSAFTEGRRLGYIKTTTKRVKGRVQFEHVIYESPLTVPCPEILNEDGSVYVAPTKRGKPNPDNRTRITEPGFPSSETPVLVSNEAASTESASKESVAPAAPALESPQEGQQETDPAQTPAADAAAPHGAGEATADPVQVPAQPTPNAEPRNATSTEKVPGGGAAAGREPETTEAYLRRKFNTRFIDGLLEEAQPLGVERRRDWFAVPLARVEELYEEARATADRHKVKVPTRLKDLLDEECRRVNVPVRTAATEDVDPDADPLAALLASATPNGNRSRR